MLVQFLKTSHYLTADVMHVLEYTVPQFVFCVCVCLCLSCVYLFPITKYNISITSCNVICRTRSEKKTEAIHTSKTYIILTERKILQTHFTRKADQKHRKKNRIARKSAFDLIERRSRKIQF